MAIKTEKQIERDFFAMLKDSELVKSVNGTLYRSGKRPSDSKKEDIVLKFLAGIDDQTQTGVVILNCYVPDIMSKTVGRMVENDKRTGVIEELVNDFIHNNSSTEYWLEPDTTPITQENKEIQQHFVYARIKFQRTTV